MAINNIDINLIYSSPLGSYRFGNKNFTLYHDDISADAFLNCLGGIEFVTQKHFIFLQLLQYEELYRFVEFLLRSLIREDHSEIVKNYFLYDHYRDEFEKSLSTLSFDNGEILKLERRNSLIYISFFSEKQFLESTSNFYFQDICVESKLFEIASIRTLENYFDIVKNVLEGQRNNVLNKMFDLWEEMRRTFLPYPV